MYSSGCGAAESIRSRIQHTKLYEVHGARVTPFLVEFLLGNSLSIFPNHSLFALHLPKSDLTADDIPALRFTVFAEAPFLELPLVLPFAVAMSAI